MPATMHAAYLDVIVAHARMRTAVPRRQVVSIAQTCAMPQYMQLCASFMVTFIGLLQTVSLVGLL